jgi:hypothetical protein
MGTLLAERAAECYREERKMDKRFDWKLLVLAVLIAAAPFTLSAQTPNADVVLTTTAECFSICLEGTNVRGVSGDITITNTLQVTANLSSIVAQVQCNGVDVPGASQNLGALNVGAGLSSTLQYSISFTPVAGCNYTVLGTGTLPSSITQGTAPFTVCDPQPCVTEGCTLTQGFWKNHEDDWPVQTLTLGTRSYTQAELLKILKQPVKGNGLVSLAHQLIAAKLNVANGATCTAATQAISSADAMIGGLVVPPIGSGVLSTSSTSALVTALDNFNNGLTSGCPGHCAEPDIP